MIDLLGCLDSGDVESVWEEHCRDSAQLKQYAGAMHCLATQVWAKQRSTRLDWCRAACLEYYTAPSGLRKVLEKEERRRAYRENQAASRAVPSSSITPEHSVGESERVSDICPAAKVPRMASDFIQSGGTILEKSTNVVDCPADKIDHSLSDAVNRPEHSMVSANDAPQRHDGSSNDLVPTGSKDPPQPEKPFIDGKIRLLDVGSCFNGFQQFDEFLAVGIDLCPAVPVGLLLKQLFS